MTKHYKASDFEKAIPNSGGIVSTIAKRVGCDWATARRAIEKSPKLTEMFENEREAILDMAESTIFMSIKNAAPHQAAFLSRSTENEEKAYTNKLSQIFQLVKRCFLLLICATMTATYQLFAMRFKDTKTLPKRVAFFVAPFNY